MFAILFGQILGLLNKILIVNAFPAAQVDAFVSANRVSETLFTLIAAGALGSAFLANLYRPACKGSRSSQPGGWPLH